MNEEGTGYCYDVRLLYNDTGEKEPDNIVSVDAQEMANRTPAPTWDDKVEEFSDTFAGNVAAGVTMLNPFTLSGVSMKTMADMMFRDMTLAESLVETGEFAKGYNQSGLKMAGNTVIGFVTMPDTIAELSDQVIDQGLTNTGKNMVNATISGIKDRYHEDFINGDARSRGEYAGDALTVVGDVALTVMGAGKVFRVGDAASDMAKVGKLADTFDDISDTARTIDKIEDITDVSKLEDSTSAVSKVEKVDGLKSDEYSNAKFATEEKLVSHFEKHGDEFKGLYNSADEYLQGAREVMNNGYKVEYSYKGEIRIGYVQFIENNSKGKAKFAFVGTNNEGYITTFHTESGKTFWKLLNDGENSPVINPK